MLDNLLTYPVVIYILTPCNTKVTGTCMEMCAHTQSAACMSGETSSTDYWWVLGTLVAAQVFDYVPLTIHSGT